VGTFLSLHKFEIDPVWEELDRRVLESFIRGFFKQGNFESRNRKKHSRRKRSRSTWLALVSATSIKQRVVTSIPKGHRRWNVSPSTVTLKAKSVRPYFGGWLRISSRISGVSSPRSPPSSFL